MAAVREFGFICGDFAVGQENGVLVPRSEETYFARSLIPGGEEAELTGRYLLPGIAAYAATIAFVLNSLPRKIGAALGGILIGSNIVLAIGALGLAVERLNA